MNEEWGTREHGWSGTGGESRGEPLRERPGFPYAGPDGDDRPAAAMDRNGTPSRGRRRHKGKRRKARAWWVELPVLIVFAFILALVIKTFVIQAFFIPSSSMEDTLLIGDKVLVNKLVYDFRPIHRGDIIVFNGEGSWDRASLVPTPPLERLWNAVTGLFGTAPGVHDYIKRVIGVPGDHVACCNTRGQVTVNGVPLSEKPYLFPGASPSAVTFRVTVPPGDLWVMGDNREISYDSRGHQGDPGGGAIPEDKVVGRAFVIVWPVSRWRIVPIPATFEQPRLAAAGRGGAPPASGHAPVAVSARPARPAAPLVPLALGLTGAVPLTLLQRRTRGPLARGLAAGWRAGRRRAGRALARLVSALPRWHRTAGPGRW